MFLIQSNCSDKSTNDVLDWFFFFGIKEEELNRFNDATVIHNLTYTLSNKDGEVININNGDFKSQNTQSFWYRRGGFSFTKPLSNTDSSLLQPLVQGISGNLSREQKYIDNSIYTTLNKKRSINTFQENFTNKITNLTQAMESRLNIPDVLVTNDFNQVIHFSSLYKKIITKDIEMNEINASYDDNYNFIIGAGVQVLTNEEVTEISKKYQNRSIAKFAFYQQYIEKKYELRIFYLKGKFYTMAIFSQSNEKTKIDFRNYDTERPNRCVPYQLPGEIEEKLHCFMQTIDMNCGSIDMIYTPEGEYVFLEVNPVGQFQWVSVNCNYDIERQIALDLINT
ncbi:grasp-with-spasm system ATP-grasp peptide maturase [Chryseobacterium herbae]|uniref:Grasp-with-spasm system ATP-grasp peptide maturase n=1 Tax=Chryseobacterium herbae TaxID=2976476 RepID=A0ABT2IXT8_9FLAO|nr:grasp-with-spasm system ATP-grasp peptide maturase [Chryseobacterium sp. pc1-10]MCT2563654.1 grasp-with-spasm system ATP-grasp peptide maturase [Chryseobacterium sp. pc1-10]